jgi:hypothetical protein
MEKFLKEIELQVQELLNKIKTQVNEQQQLKKKSEVQTIAKQIFVTHLSAMTSGVTWFKSM